MERVEGCGFQGTLWGEEQGVEVFIAINAELEGDGLLTGEMFVNPDEDEDSDEGEDPEEAEDPEGGLDLKDPRTWNGGGSMDISCTGYRAFETIFLEPLSEEEYPKLKKRMEKKLEEFHKKNRSGPA